MTRIVLRVARYVSFVPKKWIGAWLRQSAVAATGGRRAAFATQKTDARWCVLLSGNVLFTTDPRAPELGAYASHTKTTFDAWALVMP